MTSSSRRLSRAGGCTQDPLLPDASVVRSESTNWAEIPSAATPKPARPAPALKLAAASGPAAASSVKVGDLTVTAPWTRATPGGAKVAGGYVTITNTGASADRLLSATFAQAGRVEIHEMAMKDGVMIMRRWPTGWTFPQRHRDAGARRVPHHVHGPEAAAERGRDRERNPHLPEAAR